MGRDSDIAVLGNAQKEIRRLRRTKYGINCPRCREARPKANPTLLMPMQKCKVDGYVDPRPRLTRGQEDALWASQGFTRIDRKD